MGGNPCPTEAQTNPLGSRMLSMFPGAISIEKVFLRPASDRLTPAKIPALEKGFYLFKRLWS